MELVFYSPVFLGVADIPLPCRNLAAAPLQQEGLLGSSAAGLQLDFFLLTKFLAIKKKKKKMEFLHQQVWELKPTGGRRMHYTPTTRGKQPLLLDPPKVFVNSVSEAL